MEENSESRMKQNKSVIRRLSIMSGQLEGIKRMVQENRECSEVLVQISAVKSALNNTAKLILENHINHCIEDAMEKNDKSFINGLNKVIDKFID